MKAILIGILLLFGESLFVDALGFAVETFAIAKIIFGALMIHIAFNDEGIYEDIDSERKTNQILGRFFQILILCAGLYFILVGIKKFFL